MRVKVYLALPNGRDPMAIDIRGNKKLLATLRGEFNYLNINGLSEAQLEVIQCRYYVLHQGDWFKTNWTPLSLVLERLKKLYFEEEDDDSRYLRAEIAKEYYGVKGEKTLFLNWLVRTFIVPPYWESYEEDWGTWVANYLQPDGSVLMICI